MRVNLARVMAIGFAVIAAVLVGISSRLPYSPRNADDALVRLSWRMQVEAERDCRPLTKEELREIPVHMRRTEECELRAIPYLLEVVLDDEVRLSETVGSSTSRGDRPLFIHHEVPIRAGQHALRVSIGPEARTETEPSTFVLDRSISVQPGGVVLVTYDDTQRALRLSQ